MTYVSGAIRRSIMAATGERYALWLVNWFRARAQMRNVSNEETPTECGVTNSLSGGLICVAPLNHDSYHMSIHGVGWSKYHPRSSDYVGGPDFSVEEALGG